MGDIFWSTFLAMASPVGQIMLVAFIGGVLVHRKYVKNEWIKGLAGMMVNVFTPSLIFTKIVKGFKPDDLPFWWTLPLATVIIMSLGIGLAYLLFWRSRREKSTLIAVSSIHNANYLVLPIGLLAYADRFDEFAAYVFLIVLAVSPMAWSLGKVFVTPRSGKLSIKAFITPPFIANIMGVLVVLLGLRDYVPAMLFNPLEMIGSAAVPSGNFILGATLGAISFKAMPPFWDAFRVALVKYIWIPLITLALVYYSGLYKSNFLLAELAMIQAASAPAAALVIQVRNYGGNEQQIGSNLLIAYCLALFFIPFWLAFSRMISGI